MEEEHGILTFYNGRIFSMPDFQIKSINISTNLTSKLKSCVSLLAFITLSAAQSSVQTRIHSAILVINTSNNASYNQVHWLVRTSYLSIKASNGVCVLVWRLDSWLSLGTYISCVESSVNKQIHLNCVLLTHRVLVTLGSMTIPWGCV